MPLIETTLTFAVRQNQINKFNMIISNPIFDPIKSNIKDALFASILSPQTEMLTKLLKFIKDVNIESQSNTPLFDSLYANFN